MIVVEEGVNCVVKMLFLDIKCLQIIMEQNAKRLTKDCKSMLTKRLEMYKNAAQVSQNEQREILIVFKSFKNK